MARIAPSLIAAALLLQGGIAAADGPDAPEEKSLSAGGIGLLVVGGMTRADVELGEAPGTDLPDPLRNTRLDLRGNGWSVGGGLRTSYQGDIGWRIGMAVSSQYLGGLHLVHGDLPAGVSARLDEAMAADIDVFFGWGFDADFMYPYLDAVASFDIVAASLAVDIDGFGHVGDAEVMAFVMGVQPRVGAFIPLDGDWYIDTGIHLPLVGLETFGGYLAFGTWDNY